MLSDYCLTRGDKTQINKCFRQSYYFFPDILNPPTRYNSFVCYLCQCLLSPQVGIHSTCINAYFLGLGSLHLLFWTLPVLCFFHLVPEHSLLSENSSFSAPAVALRRTCPSGNSSFSPKLSTTLCCLTNKPTTDLHDGKSSVFY